LRHLFFLIITVSTIAGFYFLLDILTNSSVFMLLIFILLGILGFFIQKKLYEFLMLEFKFIYLTKEVEIPLLIKTIRDTCMDLAFVLILASFGLNPILDIIEAKTPSFSIHFFYIELAFTSIAIALLPTILYCYYYIWKNPRSSESEEQLNE